MRNIQYTGSNCGACKRDNTQAREICEAQTCEAKKRVKLGGRFITRSIPLLVVASEDQKRAANNISHYKITKESKASSAGYPVYSRTDDFMQPHKWEAAAQLQPPK